MWVVYTSYIHTNTYATEYYSVLKKEEILSLAMIQINKEDIMQSEISQARGEEGEIRV
jgi:hypothetical protein